MSSLGVKPFSLTPRQLEANKLIASPARHILLRGGSRSGKTFLFCRAIVIRAIKAPGSSHVIFRFRFNHLKESIINGTMPSVMSLCFPQIPHVTNKTDWYTTLPGDSRIIYGGLDDKDRTEKILGQEHSTIFMNECSQIAYQARNKAVTRLAQNSGLSLKAYYDENPPSAAHWSYRMFMKLQEPTSGIPLVNPDNYATMQMNPMHNIANLPKEYLQELDALPERERRRFRDGEFLSELPGALWTLDVLEKNRVTPSQVPPLKRVVVAIDPSGCQGEEDKRSDEIGLVAAGVDFNNHGYLLADNSGHYSPEGWARKALDMFDEYGADKIIAEKNFGGAMVENTIRTIRRNAPVRIVTASRGKIQRAEPVAAVYEKNQISHVGVFPEMEDQMLSFTTSGYEGSGSPDRADAAVWAFTDLMVQLGSFLSFSRL
jgi:phage terminase large subunit-like protein